MSCRVEYYGKWPLKIVLKYIEQTSVHIKRLCIKMLLTQEREKGKVD